MKIKYLRQYRKSGTGTIMFVYQVLGTEEQLAAYEEAMGENYREDDTDGPLFFSQRFVGNTTGLIITPNKRVVADTSKFDQAASLAASYGGNLGHAIASAAASELLNFGAGVRQAQPQPSGATAGAGPDDEKLDGN